MEAEDTNLDAKGNTEGGAGGGDSSAEDSAKAAAEAAAQASSGNEQGDSLLSEPQGEGEKKAEGEQKEGDEKDAKKEGDEAAKLTPESYGDFEIPEGAVVHPELMAEFKQTMADEGFSKEAAQKVINLRAKQLQMEGEAWKTVRQQWVQELKTDKEFGGEKFDQTCTGARLALRQFDLDGSALKALQASNYDNCPAIVRLLSRVHAALGEDGVHTGKETDNTKTVPLHGRLWKPEDMGGV